MNTPAVQSSRLRGLALVALGVVFGDIGTSPLYAIKECFHSTHGIPPNGANVIGVLSLIVWSLILVVSVKYLIFILRADNDGEGGLLALFALVPVAKQDGAKTGIALAAILGTALLYGDGIITPAISVLAALEGLEVATSAAQPVIVPVTALFCLCFFGYSVTAPKKLAPSSDR